MKTPVRAKKISAKSATQAEVKEGPAPKFAIAGMPYKTSNNKPGYESIVIENPSDEPAPKKKRW